MTDLPDHMGAFTLHAEYDSEELRFGEGPQGLGEFHLDDPHGILSVETITASIPDLDLLTVWKTVRTAREMGRIVGRPGTTISLPIDTISVEGHPSCELVFTPYYGTIEVSENGINFETGDKHGDQTIRSRDVAMWEIENHLVAANLMREIDRLDTAPDMDQVRAPRA